MRYNF